MTPSRDPDADTQRAAAAFPGAPETAPESDRDRALAALFGTPVDSAEQPPARSEAEEAARHDQLAALFGGAPTAPVTAGSAAGTSGAEWAESADAAPSDATDAALAALLSGRATPPAAADRASDRGAAGSMAPGDRKSVGESSDSGAVTAAGHAAAAAGAAILAAGAGAVAQGSAQAADVAPARGMRRGRRRRASVHDAESAPATAAEPGDVDVGDLPGDGTAAEERSEAPAWLAAAAAAPLVAGAVAANAEPNSDEAASDAPATDEAISAPANDEPRDAGADGDAGHDVDDDPLAWLGFTDGPASDDDTAGTEDEPARVAAGADAPAAPMPAVDWASLVNGTAATSVLPTAADDATELLGTPGPRRTADDATRVLGATAVGTTAGLVGAGSAAALSGAQGGVSTPAPVTATVDPSAGSFSPTEKRGVRAWSKKVRWSVAISIVLLAGVVAGSILIAQTVAANSREAQELSAAVADLEAAEAAATEPEFALQEAIGIYDDTVELAQATADSAGPPLAAVAGMTDETLLTASNTALADLVAQLAVDTAFEAPAEYERGDVALTDLDAIAAATERAEAHATAVTAATDRVRLAQAALQQKLDALRAAQVALGASLPATAEVIAAENRRAEQSFRDAVIAAAAAVPAAQNAGGSGDVELTAYAAAVTALRGDQVRAEEVVEPVRPANPVNPAPQPTPTTDPAPAPDPAPEPTPTDPAPVPSPTDPPVTP